MSNLVKREAFLKLLSPPWWDSKRNFSGTFYSQVKHCKVAFTVLSLEELLKKLSFTFYPDHDDINIIFDSSIHDLAKKLEKALKRKSFQVDLIIEDKFMREGMQSIVAPVTIPMHKAFYSESKKLEQAGIHSLHELALLSSEVIAQTTGFSLSKANKLNSVATFLQIGMPFQVAEYTYQIADINCLHDFIKYDSKALFHKLSDFVPSLTLAMINEWKLSARSVGVCMLLKTILNYSTDEIIIIIKRLGIQTITARFHLLITSFNHPSLNSFKTLLEQFFGQEFFEDRQKLQRFLSEIEQKPKKLDRLRNDIQLCFSEFFEQLELNHSIGNIISLDSKSKALLNREGIYDLCDLRIIDLDRIARLTSINKPILSKWKDIADLMTYNVIENSFAYTLVDGGFTKQAIHYYTYQNHRSSYRFFYPMHHTKRAVFEYSDYQGVTSPIIIHYKKLFEEGVVPDNNYTDRDYLLRKSNSMGLHQAAHVRVGLAVEGDFKYYLSHLVNEHSKDLVCRLIPVPMSSNYKTEYMREEKLFMLLDISFGNKKISAPKPKEDRLTRYNIFYKQIFTMAEELSELWDAPIEWQQNDFWEEPLKLEDDNYGTRPLRITIPENSTQQELIKFIKAYEQVVWASMNYKVGWIMGQVVDDTGYPVPGVEVTLSAQKIMMGEYFPRDRKFASQITNASGRYAFRIAHSPAYYGNDGRGATLQLFKSGLLISDSKKKVLLQDETDLNFSHQAKVINHF